MFNKKTILLVEDEPHLAFNISFNLKKEGYEVIHIDNGQEAVDAFDNRGPFCLVILDIMLPKLDGFEVTRQIRNRDKRIGILILTARASEQDLVHGFEMGADDYLTKPFKLAELISRVHRMAERAEFISAHETGGPSILECGAIRLDLDSLMLKSATGDFHLTLLEAKVLAEFLNNPDTILSREHLLKAAWGIHRSIETRTVDNFILRLRKYIEPEPSKPKYIQSIRGRGYLFQTGA